MLSSTLFSGFGSTIALFLSSLSSCSFSLSLQNPKPQPQSVFLRTYFSWAVLGALYFWAFGDVEYSFWPKHKDLTQQQIQLIVKVITIFQQKLKLKLKIKNRIYILVWKCAWLEIISIDGILIILEREFLVPSNISNNLQILKDTKISIFFRSITRISQTHNIKIQTTIFFFDE